jgi:hypothetical protein
LGNTFVNLLSKQQSYKKEIQRVLDAIDGYQNRKNTVELKADVVDTMRAFCGFCCCCLFCCLICMWDFREQWWLSGSDNSRVQTVRSGFGIRQTTVLSLSELQRRGGREDDTQKGLQGY